jgi:hypothetical protein
VALGSYRQLPYSERLKRLKLPSAQYRRKRGDLVQIYKYLNGLSQGPVQTLLPHMAKDTNARTRGHTLKLTKRRCRTNLRLQSFGYRVNNNWNSLHNNTGTALTLNLFKNSLDKELVAELSLHE